MTARRPSSIVLGGGGFLGVSLCRRLAAAGGRVRAFGRRCPFPQALGVDRYQGDFSEAAGLAAAIESYEMVFHPVQATSPHSTNLDVAAELHSSPRSRPSTSAATSPSNAYYSFRPAASSTERLPKFPRPKTLDRADHGLRHQQVGD
jgi:NAD(P)-dependent dehydrogenase (short-subunit alcohol dehydrogenase family)